MYSKFDVTCLSEHIKGLQTRNSSQTQPEFTRIRPEFTQIISIIIYSYLIIKHVSMFEITDVAS